MIDCKNCIHYAVCREYHDQIPADAEIIVFFTSDCKHFAEASKMVRCGNCKYAVPLGKHCEINGKAYRHCSMWRGELTNNVWHKYTKVYRDYSIVDINGYCDAGEEEK